MEVLKMHESIANVKESHDVLKTVISSDRKMQIHLNKTVESAKKEIQNIFKIQNEIILLENKTEARFDEIWEKTELFVKNEIAFFEKPFIALAAVAISVILVIIVINLKNCWYKLSSRKNAYNSTV
jgi:hypothetical protein